LEQLSILTTRRKRSSAGRITKNSKFFKSIINAIQDKKGENIISLDLRKISEAVADFFIICEAGSTTQVKAIADFIEFHTKNAVKEIPYRSEGQHSGQWVLVDYINVVVHIMLPETRKFYKLEEMWSDAVAEEHNS
jgi:ribosome-associated protein